MWNVEERFSPKAIEGLAALGFAVGSTRGVVRVEKYGCGAEFRKGTDERYQMTIAPTRLANKENLPPDIKVPPITTARIASSS